MYDGQVKHGKLDGEAGRIERERTVLEPVLAQEQLHHDVLRRGDLRETR